MEQKAASRAAFQTKWLAFVISLAPFMGREECQLSYKVELLKAAVYNVGGRVKADSFLNRVVAGLCPAEMGKVPSPHTQKPEHEIHRAPQGTDIRPERPRLMPGCWTVL